MKKFSFLKATAVTVFLLNVPAFAVPWASKHGMTASEYQAEFHKWTSEPYEYRLISVAGYEQGGQAHYAAVWEDRPGPGWLAHSGMTKVQFDSLRATSTTSCRFFAKTRASSSPMPLDAPVMRAVIGPTIP